MLKVDLRGILELEKFCDEFDDVTRSAVSISINSVLGGPGLQKYKDAVAAEINFPPGYVDDRIQFSQRATPTRLEATVVGRQRPTSLARFASGSVGQKGGVTVRVKGSSKYMPNAFKVRLQGGEDGNIGLAIRLKEGQTINKKDMSNAVYLERNVVLLYGPSIDQVLRNGVANDVTPEVTDDIAQEFFRNFARMA